MSCDKKCENYKPKGYPDCYKNQCAGCKCDGCLYARDCETRIAKCSYCKKLPTITTYPYAPYIPSTPTITWTATGTSYTNLTDTAGNAGPAIDTMR